MDKTVNPEQPKSSSQVTSNRKQPRSKMLEIVALILIILLGIFLRFYQLGSTGDGNLYYASTVKSMLMSWHNFFYASFEPGGSVSVDKPPLGFWIEALSARLLGVNGFALALPNALAGVLSIPLLFFMVKKQFGTLPGLLAALVLAAAPIAIATDRNNSIDGMLVFVLLLAIWILLKSIERRRWGYLLISAAVVGLGFNIKMLQAYMVLPALYLVYLVAAPHKWWKRILHLIVATVVLIVVSFAWIVAVDLTPADQRPYVGSSTDNTEIELIIGHNGLERLGLNRLLQGIDRNLDDGAPANPTIPFANGGTLPRPPISGQGLVPPSGQPPVNGQIFQSPPRDGGFNPGAGGLPGGQRQSEVGTAGLLRLFTQPLSDQASWLLPFTLLGLILTAVVLRWQKPLNEKHIGLILWIAWLLPMVVYFTFTTGLWHTYYLIMLVPGIAGLVGATAWALWKIIQKKCWSGWGLTLILTALTLTFQIIVLHSFPKYALGVSLTAGGIWLVGIGLLAVRSKRWALGIVLVGLLIAPVTWSFLTTFNPSPNTGLPKAGPVGNDTQGINPFDGLSNNSQTTSMDFLTSNTAPGTYLLAVESANEAAPYILATGRPVLTFGGFLGTDNIIDATGLAKMVSQGKLRYVAISEQLVRNKPAIAAWVKKNCTIAILPGNTQRINNGNTLYDCAKP